MIIRKVIDLKHDVCWWSLLYCCCSWSTVSLEQTKICVFDNTFNDRTDVTEVKIRIQNTSSLDYLENERQVFLFLKRLWYCLWLLLVFYSHMFLSCFFQLIVPLVRGALCSESVSLSRKQSRTLFWRRTIKHVLVCTTKRSARLKKFNVKEEYRGAHLENNNKAVNRKVILWQPLQPEI